VGRFLEALRGLGKKVKGPSSKGEYEAQCPAHEDRRPSLSFNTGDDGQVIFKCHAGCKAADILRAAGLDWSDLWPGDGPERKNGKPEDVEISRTRWETAGEYVYRDETGRALYKVVRKECNVSYRRTDGTEFTRREKTFSQFRATDGGAWKAGIEGVRRVPYNLPALLAAPRGSTVYVVEGEQCVDALTRLGLLATTTSGGANNWNNADKETVLRALRGQHVVALPDNDSAGHKYTEEAVRDLLPVAADVKILHLPGLREHGDIVDWLADEHTIAELEGLVADLVPATEAVPHDESRPYAGTDGPESEPPIAPPVSLGQLLDTRKALRPVVIDGLLRESETMNIIASSKVGKSWCVLDLVLAVATGRNWLETFACAKGPVLVIDNELHEETFTDRVRKVAAARNIPLADVRDAVHVRLLRGKLRDVSQLHGMFKQWGIKPGDYSLLVLDAKYRFLPPGTNENSNADMARVYNWVDEMADCFHMSIALVHHSSKGDQSQKAVTDVGAGAGSIARATDTHVILRPHEEEDVAVMDVALRSFAPVPARCYRWEFPVWTPADDLSPDLLGNPAKRKKEQADHAKVQKEGTLLLSRLDEYDPQRQGATISKLRKWTGWGLDKVNRVVASLLQEGILEEFTVTAELGSGATRSGLEGVRRKTRS
jgi:hypothetical protein